MKNFIAITTISLILFFSTSCTEEKRVEFKPVNHLQEFSKVKLQTFELDTNLLYIKGEKGTEIWFARDLFNVTENQKITLELKEFYDFEELLFNNINTVTDKNELLESSGVIFLDFKADGESIELKNNKRLQIRFPNNRLKKNSLYYAKTDSINQFRWTKEDKLFTYIMEFNNDFKIDMPRTIPMDSLAYYQERDSLASEIDFENADSYSISNQLLISKLKWINIDKVITPDYLTDFELVIENSESNNYTFYFIYEDLNSFMSDYRTKNNLDFIDIPVKNKTEIVIVGKNKRRIFAKKIQLDSSQNKIKFALNEVDTTQLRKLIRK